MAKGQIMPKAIQNSLETREVKLRRLLDQTSSDKTSSKHRKEFITPQIVLKMLRKEKNAVAAVAA